MDPRLNHFTKKDTSIEHYDGCPAFIELTGGAYTRSLYNSDIPHYSLCASFFRKRQGDYLTLISDQGKIGQAIIEKFIRDEKEILDLYQQWLGNFAIMMDSFKNKFADNLSSLSNEELSKWSDDLNTFYRDTIQMPGFSDGYMFYADKRLDELLTAYCEERGLKNKTVLFATLAAPTEPSFLNEAENDLKGIGRLCVAAGYNPKDSLLDFLETKNVQGDLIKEHIQKYAFIQSSYAGYVPYTFKDAVEKISKLDLAAEEDKHFMVNAEIKRKTINEHTFSKEILAIAQLTEIFIKWQDRRKEYTLMAVSLRQKVLDEVSRRTGVSDEVLVYAETAEIPKILAGTIDIDAIAKRQDGCLFLYENGRTVAIIVGTEAMSFFENLSHIELNDVTEIRGLTASLGKVRGRAKIVMTAQHINEVKPGDILIAPMTRPEHTVGMQAAAAIVTDDGGITCHAAIVSRELKKPCIIGTKIATKIFKDGDMLEVDADYGVVRKI